MNPLHGEIWETPADVTVQIGTQITVQARRARRRTILQTTIRLLLCTHDPPRAKAWHVSNNIIGTNSRFSVGSEDEIIRGIHAMSKPCL